MDLQGQVGAVVSEEAGMIGTVAAYADNSKNGTHYISTTHLAVRPHSFLMKFNVLWFSVRQEQFLSYKLSDGPS
jgi:hypothetical protein